ncbi:feoA family protein [Mycoplasma sp. CAG:776]|nr:feoA family protein [Mycoplasma sp. CAG:776]
MMTLDQMNLNDIVNVINIYGESRIKRRLLDLGFIPGEEVKCVLISPFKDPKAYKIAGNVIALRSIDARNVEVTYEKC